MRLVLNNGEIALPKDFAFQIQQNHPFFSTEGSKSAPTTLPASADNMKILKYPADINRSSRFAKQYDARLIAGSYQKGCRMVVDSGHVFDGIDVSLALDESEGYAELKDKGLREVLADVNLSPGRTSVWNLYTANPSTRTEALVFPVAVDKDGDGSSATVNLLNEVNSAGTGFVDSSRQISHGSDRITVPAGYGITAFLRLPELLAKVFQTCGYTIASNVFMTDNKLKNLVLLNNCSDALLSSTYTGIGSNSGWKMRYYDLVPDITIGELITWLRDKFGAFITISGKAVSIRLFRNACSATPDVDLTKYMDGKSRPSVSYPSPKTIQVSVDTSLDGAAPAAESLEALRDSHQNMMTVQSREDATGSGLFFVSSLGKYFFRNSGWSSLSQLGSNAFPYKRTTEIKEVEEIAPEDCFASMILHTTSGKYLPYIGESIRRNTDADDNDKQQEQKIIVCNAIWSGSHWQGSPYDTTDAGGNASSGVGSLTPEGLYSDYWQDYHRLLLNGAPDIACSFHIPSRDLFAMDLWTPKIFHGMKCLIKQLSYILSDKGIITVEMTLQSIPAYTDAVELPEVPAFGINLAWRLVSDDEGPLQNPSYGEDYEVEEWDGLSAPPYPDFEPSYLGQTTGHTQRWYRYYITYQGYRQPFGGTHYYTQYYIAVFAGD